VTAADSSEPRTGDHEDVSEEKASVISIFESLAEQLETAYRLKEDLQADLDAARKRLSEESAARAALEARVRWLEAHRPDVNGGGGKNESEAAEKATREIHGEATRVMLQAELDISPAERNERKEEVKKG
jgi:hypothetical protein